MENNIVVLDGKTLNPGDLSWSSLERLGNLSVYNETEYHQILERSQEASILIANKVKLDAPILDQLKKLKYISIMATGYDNIDVDHARSKNIPVSNVSDYSTPAVAQSVFAHLLNILNRTADYNNEVHQGVWSSKTSFSYWYDPITELNEKTLGIIGYGKIAKKVAQIADAFGMDLLVCNRSKISDENINQVSFDELLKHSDVVTVHVPLNADTQNMFSKSAFEKMKPNAILINTSRGGVINELDLKEALMSKKIKAAGLDVLTSEPPPRDHVLLNVENCFITPHQAWGTLEARTRLLSKLSENVEAFLSGQPIRLVN